MPALCGLPCRVRAWSLAHQRHLPIFIVVETKQSPLKAPFSSVQPETFTSAVFDALDSEIKTVVAQNEMITPDQVRGTHATLQEAALAHHWPTLAEARGKVVFLMDQQNVGAVYFEGHPSLEGRIPFTNATPGTPDAASSSGAQILSTDYPASEAATSVHDDNQM